MIYLVITLVVIQVLCLITGMVQGIRYIKTDPLFKAIPWLLPAMVLAPIITILASFAEKTP